MGNFKQIKKLNISHNCLTEINESIIKCCPCLQTLDASYNKITFLTTEISNWGLTLSKLKLNHNLIIEIPVELTQIHSLKFLKLNHN